MILVQQSDWETELGWTYTIVPAFFCILTVHSASLLMLWKNEWKTSKSQGAVFIAMYLVTITTAVAISFAESKGLLR